MGFNHLIVIYSNRIDDYQNLKKHLNSCNINDDKIIYCDSKMKSRLEVIDEYKNTWLYFLDSDCYPNESTLNYLTNDIELASGESCVMSGEYKNPSSSYYLQRVQNKISNTWLNVSYDLNFKYKNLIGGNFIVYNNSVEKLVSKIKPIRFWGAEDMYLGHVLQDSGFKFIKDDKIIVEHRTSPSVFHFFRRAWLHGVNEVKYIDQNKITYQRIKYFAWLRRFGFQDLFLVPAIFLHFCIQKLAKLTQKVLQVHKITK